MATTIRCRRRAIPVQGNASAAGAGNDMLTVLQLHKFRVQLPERVARRDQQQIEALTAARAASGTVLVCQLSLPTIARLLIGTNEGRNFVRWLVLTTAQAGLSGNGPGA